MTRLDIVIPVFNEIEIMETLHARVVAAGQTTGHPFHIIYVDDGSRDGTAQWIHDHALEQDDLSLKFPGHQVSLIQLSRNFGQPAAILAGLHRSTGDCVVIMDGDLQDPPELIGDMLRHWEQGDEVVIAQRKSRKESFLRGIAFKLFHLGFQYLSDSPIPPNTGTFCLLDKAAAMAICEMPESHRFFPGLREWVGFRQRLLPFDRQERAGGEPKQNFVRLFKYALDAVFGFSLKPLRLLTSIGITVCLFSSVVACWFVFKRVIGWETASIGFTTLTCAVIGLGGFQLIGLGILGEFIGRIYDEVKGRPQFLVAREFHSNSQETKSPEATIRSVRKIA